MARRIVFTDNNLVSITFLEVFLGPFSNVNNRIMPMSGAVSSEGPKTTGIQQRSPALSLTHKDFSSFSESFDDVMHCRWWDLQSLCNLMLRNVALFHRLLHSFPQFYSLNKLTLVEESQSQSADYSWHIPQKIAYRMMVKDSDFLSQPSLLLRDSASLRHPFYS